MAMLKVYFAVSPSGEDSSAAAAEEAAAKASAAAATAVAATAAAAKQGGHDLGRPPTRMEMVCGIKRIVPAPALTPAPSVPSVHSRLKDVYGRAGFSSCLPFFFWKLIAHGAGFASARRAGPCRRRQDPRPASKCCCARRPTRLSTSSCAAWPTAAAACATTTTSP